MLKVYAPREHPDATYWEQHWRGEDVSNALAFLSSGLDYHRPFLDRFLPLEGQIADVGCGLARVALHYREIGRRTLGLDLAPAVLRAVRAVDPSVPLVVGRAEQLPFRPASLAAYVGLGVFEYDERGPGPMLGEAHRVLAPAGVLYLTVPYLNHWRWLTRRWPGGTFVELSSAPPRGMYFQHYVFTESEILGLVRGAGFEVMLHRPVSIAWGLRSAVGGSAVAPRGQGVGSDPGSPKAHASRLKTVLRDALVRERPTGALAAALVESLRPVFANSCLVVAVRPTGAAR